MFPYVCSVIDHRWRQNVVRMKAWHTRRKPSVSLMFLSAHFDVFCDLLLNRPTATWNLFVLYHKKQQKKLFYFKIFQPNSETVLCPLWRTRKKAIWRNLLTVQNEAISLVAMRRKELWLVQEYHATVKLKKKIASRGLKTYNESRIKLRIKMLKSQVSFWHQSSPVSQKSWELICLEYCRSWKNTLEKLAVAVNTGDHSIWVLDERNISDGGNLCPLCQLVILKSVWCSVGDTL